MTCEARVRRGGYFSRHDEVCGKPAKGTCPMIKPDYSGWVRDRSDVPACGVHLRAKYVVWAGGVS